MTIACLKNVIMRTKNANGSSFLAGTFSKTSENFYFKIVVVRKMFFLHSWKTTQFQNKFTNI